MLRYAGALGIHERYLDEVAAAANDRLQEALADMPRSNMESITGRPWSGGDVNKWLMPYGNGQRRSRARGALCELASKLPPRQLRSRVLAALQGEQLHLPGRSARR